MALPIIYVLLFLSAVILILGFVLEDWIVKSLASLFFMSSGVWVLRNGIGGLTDVSLAVQGLGFVLIGVGAYIIIRSNIEKISS